MGNTSSTYLLANKIERNHILIRREESHQKHKDTHRIAIVNQAVKDYNAGHIGGTAIVDYSDKELNYCEKLREIIGDDLVSCRYTKHPIKSDKYILHYDFNLHPTINNFAARPHAVRE
jgi:hypothetical protein